MMTSSPISQRYGSLTIHLHWLMLALIAAVYVLMEFRGIFPKGSAGRDAMKHWHYMLGLLVFGLALLRLLLRWAQSTPRIEPEPSVWQKQLSVVVQALMYALMLGLPLAGWMILSAEGQPIPFFGLDLPALVGPDKVLGKQIEKAHETVATLGYVLIGLHAVLALFHHYVVGDNTLLRMLPTRKGRSPL
jgi:cytochrome b561